MGQTLNRREGGACVLICVGPGIVIEEEHTDISLVEQIQIRSFVFTCPHGDLSSQWSRLLLHIV
jgi:hypothetical protein